jgi:hypothetical protein
VSPRGKKLSKRTILGAYVVTRYPWEEIADFFRGIVDGGGVWARPMLDFVEQIERSPMRDRLHAITSMHTLIVSNTPEFDAGSEVLRIDVDMKGGLLFEYVERPYAERRWRKRVAPREALGALEHLVHMKGWFIEYGDEAGGPT